MSTLVVQLDPETETKVQQAAAAEGTSPSEWVAQLVRERTTDEWPPAFDSLAGAWPDCPEIEELRAGLGKDVPRLRL
jgi:hypothetical protein